MIWFLVAQIFSTLMTLIQIGRMTETDKDLEIMVLRYQPGIAERKLKKPVCTAVLPALPRAGDHLSLGTLAYQVMVCDWQLFLDGRVTIHCCRQ